MSVCGFVHIYVGAHGGQRHWFPRTGVTGGEPPDTGWESKLGLLEEQTALFTTELSPAPTISNSINEQRELSASSYFCTCLPSSACNSPSQHLASPVYSQCGSQRISQCRSAGQVPLCSNLQWISISLRHNCLQLVPIRPVMASPCNSRHAAVLCTRPTPSNSVLLHLLFFPWNSLPPDICTVYCFLRALC